jgi:hypothetical protein
LEQGWYHRGAESQGIAGERTGASYVETKHEVGPTADEWQKSHGELGGLLCSHHQTKADESDAGEDDTRTSLHAAQQPLLL